jgi:hypothetical protein
LKGPLPAVLEKIDGGVSLLSDEQSIGLDIWEDEFRSGSVLVELGLVHVPSRPDPARNTRGHHGLHHSEVCYVVLAPVLDVVHRHPVSLDQ